MTLLIIVIALALIFDFINGFHDAANSIATIVSTKVLTPFQAVIWAAFFNFVAFFIAKYIIGEFGIANTVAKTVLPQFITLPVILSGLIAAIIWNLVTWWLGIPSSSSHTLIGGFAGAAIASAGFGSIEGLVILKIAAFIFLAPLIGMLIAVVLTYFTLYCWRKAKPHKAESWFRRLQLLSSALFSVGHGLNDSQKVMGIIAAALFAAGEITDIGNIPNWVPLACFSMIAMGTMSGGWRIVKTMGTRITKVTALEGVVAETSGAITLFITEILKIPVSTTHTITGSIIGVGAVKRLSAVRWGVTKDLLVAWILTIPVSAVMAMLVYVLIVFVIGMA
ncbi:PiT family inorganic phosphate transporter [Parabacteroides sp. PF5-5]|uniref:inorganic phosphate transporter n=1 Tax=unclassified Parabacteroides TaxID=2649774 RepID=UPI0024766CC6|nr:MULTISPECIES: inorganic phosphate transporter [unclassified Parabacteroides]MDH6306480.1 PiT family inorganic phosphate transporter [Parabacteroides sp. PH5-39]MDH6317447.1 PiT family inorganic phosphate transporter [Parabacteroides sp. PF5-13]MDH6321250.1 PiT family inorganic phosphate transporter [Parabacteroides sp. PH5-13]MDH6324982.1 PiT family inorganic phosphate transporter [Parabacteroides sp. PH5-8]MDH6328691.1 PiT family inorganic phosphate transporter [Parabacteroides sp. PH5-41]